MYMLDVKKQTEGRGRGTMAAVGGLKLKGRAGDLTTVPEASRRLSKTETSS